MFVPLPKLVAIAISLLMKKTERNLVTVVVDGEGAAVRGIEMEAEPVGEILPILEPTGGHRSVVQAMKSEVPLNVKDVEGKKVVCGVVMLRMVGTRLMLVTMRVLALEDVRVKLKEKVRLFAGMVSVCEVLDELEATVTVSGVVDLVANVRRPV